jgi:hypothetical protein
MSEETRAHGPNHLGAIKPLHCVDPMMRASVGGA